MTVCVRCGVVSSAPLGKPCPACGATFGLVPASRLGRWHAVRLARGDRTALIAEGYRCDLAGHFPAVRAK